MCTYMSYLRSGECFHLQSLQTDRSEPGAGHKSGHYYLSEQIDQGLVRHPAAAAVEPIPMLLTNAQVCA
jgi:hypothetical protein